MLVYCLLFLILYDLVHLEYGILRGIVILIPVMSYLSCSPNPFASLLFTFTLATRQIYRQIPYVIGIEYYISDW